MVAECPAASKIIRSALAGARALRMNSSIDSDHLTISTFSPGNYLMMVLTRTPFNPAHEPTGHMLGSDEWTATMVRCPGSLVMLFISTTPLATSGTCSRKSRRISSLSFECAFMGNMRDCRLTIDLGQAVVAFEYS